MSPLGLEEDFVLRKSQNTGNCSEKVQIFRKFFSQIVSLVNRIVPKKKPKVVVCARKTLRFCEKTFIENNLGEKSHSAEKKPFGLPSIFSSNKKLV